MSGLAASGRWCPLLVLVLGAASLSTQSVPSKPMPERARQPEGSVDREWRVRAWARDPQAGTSELRAALASADWQARFMALDALARTFAGVRWCRPDTRARLVVGLVVDPHPNVRAQAIELVARAGLIGRAMAEHGGLLLAETFPPARVALAQAWALSRTEAGADPSGISPDESRRIWSLLVEWERSPDPSLARAAFVALAGGRLANPEQQVSWLLDAAPGIQRGRWIDGLDLLERGGLDDLRHAAWDAALARGTQPMGVDATFALLGLRADRADGLGAIESDLQHLLAEPDWREVLAATARVRPAGLGPLLWSSVQRAQLGSHPTSETRAFLIECASDASEPWAALEQARRLDLVGARTTWQAVAARVRSWDGEGGAFWLAPERDPDLRFLAARTLGRVAGDSGSPSAVVSLLELAVDPDGRVREFAFRALCDLPAVGVADERLRQAWSTYDVHEQLESLRTLPRSRAPVAFREDLLRLGHNAASRTTSVVELLGLFGHDDEIAGAVADWLTESLDALAATAAGDAGLRVRERLARNLLWTLVRVDRNGAVAPVARTLESGVGWIEANDGHSLELAEMAARLLGADSRGRTLLIPYMEAGPWMVRAEAALALAALDGPARVDPSVGVAQGLLEEWYGEFGNEHQTRAIKACADGRGPGAVALLNRVAGDSGQDWEQRFAALTGLAHHGQLARLIDLLAGATEVEVRLACLGSIASIPGDGARNLLSESIESAAARRLEADPLSLDHEEASLLLDEALLLLAERGELAAHQSAIWLARARAVAADDIEARFSGRSLARADFRWRTELVLARRLLAAGQLRGVLDRSGAWERVDAELLFALGEGAQAGSGTAIAAEFYRAALVAYRGQPPTPAVRNRILICQVQLMELCEELEQYDEMAFWCHALRGADRNGGQVLGLLEHRWGALDLVAQRDPRARLASAAAQAEALAALGREDYEQAVRWSARARTMTGNSAEARAAQTRLEAVLSDARPR